MMRYLILLLLAVVACRSERKEKEAMDYPLLETMGYYQRFSQKLWLAGKQGNWELANFYTHELEEVTDHFISGNVVDEGNNLSNLAAGILMPSIEKVEEAIKMKDEVLFIENYKLFISSCNLCHRTNKHGFIKITIPDSSSKWNQDFSVYP